MDAKIKQIEDNGFLVAVGAINSSDNTPDWLKTLIEKESPKDVLYLLDIANQHSTYCTDIRTIAYWNQHYVDKRIAFVAAEAGHLNPLTGKKYKDDPKIIAFHPMFLNHNSGDWNVQDFDGDVACPTGTKTVNQHKQWMDAGWTQAKILTAFYQVLDANAAAWPNKALKMPIGGIKMADMNEGKGYGWMAQQVANHIEASSYANRFYLGRAVLANQWQDGTYWDDASHKPDIVTATDTYIRWMMRDWAKRHSGHITLQTVSSGINDGCRLIGQDTSCAVGADPCEPVCVLKKVIEKSMSYGSPVFEGWIQVTSNPIMYSMMLEKTKAMGGTPRP